MRKICPYCGRSGAIGTSCAGCGYVLRETDKSVPSDTRTTKIDDTIATGSQTVKLQTTPDTPQTTPLRPVSDPPKPTALPKHPSSGQKADKRHIPGLAAVFAGVVIAAYGIYGFFRTTRFYGAGDPLNGIVGNAFSAAAVACGFMCIPVLRARYGKALKFVLVAGLLLSFGIPLVLIFL